MKHFRDGADVKPLQRESSADLTSTDIFGLAAAAAEPGAAEKFLSIG